MPRRRLEDVLSEAEELRGKYVFIADDNLFNDLEGAERALAGAFGCPDALRELARCGLLVKQEEKRRGQHRHRDRGIENRNHSRGKDCARRPEQHECELARLRQRHGEHRRVGAVAIAEGLRDRIENDRLQHDQAERQAENQVRAAQEQPDVDRHADRDEEQAEQQALERIDLRFEFVPVFRIGQQHAGQ